MYFLPIICRISFIHFLSLQRGIEKAPFKLPDFIARTGISEVRSAVDEDEGNQSAKKKNRSRVAPKMGALDVDYRTLHDAFFKHQNKESILVKLTKVGDLYYEGKEFENQKSNSLKVGGSLSSRLRDALGMNAENSPPPWLINMQRFGPPPAYPALSIPGLNAPLPQACTYGYHLNGWGKPPIDAFGACNSLFVLCIILIFISFIIFHSLLFPHSFFLFVLPQNERSSTLWRKSI